LEDERVGGRQHFIGLIIVILVFFGDDPHFGQLIDRIQTIRLFHGYDSDDVIECLKLDQLFKVQLIDLVVSSIFQSITVELDFRQLLFKAFHFIRFFDFDELVHYYFDIQYPSTFIACRRVPRMFRRPEPPIP
jgi:hypothetical protein